MRSALKADVGHASVGRSKRGFEGEWFSNAEGCLPRHPSANRRTALAGGHDQGVAPIRAALHSDLATSGGVHRLVVNRLAV